MQQLSECLILGIDPGYDRVGWAVGEVNGAHDIRVVEYGAVQTNQKQTLIQRYQQIDTELTALVHRYQIAEAGIESLFFTNNQKTALHVSEARGVILSVLFRHNIQCAEFTPLQIKQAVTGFGRAEKSAVDRMLRMQYKLGQAKILDDTMDAIAVMVTHGVSRAVLGQTQVPASTQTKTKGSKS
jgi:crossover junction endodeoxyribonuclease RuvC